MHLSKVKSICESIIVLYPSNNEKQIKDSTSFELGSLRDQVYTSVFCSFKSTFFVYKPWDSSLGVGEGGAEEGVGGRGGKPGVTRV